MQNIGEERERDMKQINKKKGKKNAPFVFYFPLPYSNEISLKRWHILLFFFSYSFLLPFTFVETICDIFEIYRMKCQEELSNYA